MRVYNYTPTGRHCREGMAVEVAEGILFDTFWGAYDGSDRHRLTKAEAATAVLLFDTDDYDDVTSNHNRLVPSAWSDRAEVDRQLVTEQHGLRVRYYVRKGSQISHKMRVQNARVELLMAEEAARSATRAVELAQRDFYAALSEQESQGAMPDDDAGGES